MILAHTLSHVCKPSCGSSVDVLESNGHLLNTDQFYCVPQLSDWHVYDAVKTIVVLLGDACMVSMPGLTTDETYDLSIFNHYCDAK